MRTATRLALMPALLAVLLTGCFEPITLPPQIATPALNPGATREVELRALRLDVEGFEQTLTLADLRSLPRATLEELWLLDLQMQPLVANALLFVRDATPEQLGSQAAINMQRLLRFTPNDVDFSQTEMEEMLALSASIGAPPAKAIADLLQIDRAAAVIPLEVAAEALTIGLIGSHPAGQFRPGPVTAEHPDGQHPVTPGTIPVTLADVVDEFAGLVDKFGPVMLPDGTQHPGFIEEASGFAVIEDQFGMTVKVNLNALPYKGLDLTDASVASVNSINTQISNIFDTSDPDWLRVDGLVPEPSISKLTVRVTENPRRILPGRSRTPLPYGDGEAWTIPPWQFERLVGEMARSETLNKALPNCVEYTVGQGTVVFRGCVDATGWTTFETFNNAGNPPPDMYLWDLQHDMAQVRLHDGGLQEGEAAVAFTLNNVLVGIGATEMVERIKQNFASNPRALSELASLTNETTVGAADFFYYRARADGSATTQGDWLYFIAPTDIPRQADDAGADGQRVRPYSYPAPGFFSDEGLTQALHSRTPVDGDVDHLKVRIQAGQTLFIADDVGQVYRIDVRAKPSRARIALGVTRVR
ncbi:MAG: hypothetical protein ACI9U2_001870 [Bradymonadia bacterium]|jgi:hypothetical protein